MTTPWRLLLHRPADGPRNMAVDEALLDAYAGADPPPAPTLRLYGWSPGALSLGRGQTGAHDPAFLRRQGLGLVRRPTGGLAVLHEHERTYAIVARLRSGSFPEGVLDTYHRIAGALLAALRRLGVEAGAFDPAGCPARPAASSVCFEEPAAHEIEAGGRKLVGSAQRRRRGAFLQHGSILFRQTRERVARATGEAGRSNGRFGGLEDLLGHPPDPTEVDSALVAGFEEIFGVRLAPGDLSPAEAERVELLRCWKYESAAWTLEGRVGERERARVSWLVA